MTEYRTKMQRDVSDALGEDVRGWVVWRVEHDGMTYKQIVSAIYNATGYIIRWTTVSRWYFYWRTGR